MGVDEHIANLTPRIPLLDKIAQGEEIAGTLRHLLAVHFKMRAMHPRIYELSSCGSLSLSDFVFMMREKIVDSACMKIKRFAEILHRHGRAFNMPARAPAPPWGIPADGTVTFLPRLPKRKIADILFVIFVGRAPRARALVVKINMSKRPVTGEFADIEIDRAVVRLIRYSLLHKFFNERDHFRNVICRRRVNFRTLDVESFQIGKKSVLVSACVIIKRLALLIRVSDCFIVDIRQIHHLLNAHSAKLDDAAQHILKRVCAEITDMGKVVYGRPARIHANYIAFKRLKFLGLPGKRIEYFHKFYIIA